MVRNAFMSKSELQMMFKANSIRVCRQGGMIYLEFKM